MSVLYNKKILLAVAGSVAIYRSLELVRLLRKEGADVHVVMTRNAVKLISPQLFEAVSGNFVCLDMFSNFYDEYFDLDEQSKKFLEKTSMKHIDLALKSDVMLFCPASANIIGKLAHGIADDLVTTVALAFSKEKIVCPAMNDKMWDNVVVQKNVQILRSVDFDIIEPEKGDLACGSYGIGRLAELDFILQRVKNALNKKDLFGKKVLITAGPTVEKIDPVRYISNFSSGKIGYALAQEAVLRGAEVILISGKTSLRHPFGVKFIQIESAQEMYDAVMKELNGMDYFVCAASIVDFRSKKMFEGKLKKAGLSDGLNLELTLTQDLLRAVSSRFKKKSKKPLIIGFALETEKVEINALRKLKDKNVDLIVANGPDNLDADIKKFILLGKRGYKSLIEGNVSVCSEELWNKFAGGSN